MAERGGAAAEAVLTRADLLALGMRPQQITRAVREGRVVRVRRDRYMISADTGTARAVRVGGRLSCVSLLAAAGAYVFEHDAVHVHLAHSMSRLRSPSDARRRFGPRDRDSTVLHWWPLAFEPASLGAVALEDALGHAVRCQPVVHAVATVDSVLHLGILAPVEVADVFAALPARFGVILRLSDASAESGTESLMRLILRRLGLRYETQVRVPGVGRVDFVVDGWLIIECDSRAHHEGWVKQKRDRRRDLAAATLGMTTLRPLAEDLLFHPEGVVAAVRGLHAARR